MNYNNNPNNFTQNNVSNLDFQTNQNPSSSYPFISQNHHQPIMIPVPALQQQQQQQQQQTLLPFEDDDFQRKEERYPQWNNQETKDLIDIRAELEWDFSTVKRNKNLWEMVVFRMKEKGYRRSIDQCKCKWKNLVNRYKGRQVSDQDNSQKIPYFNELHKIFTARAHRQAHPEYETAAIKGKGKRKLLPEVQSPDDYLLPQENEETEANPTMKRNKKPAAQSEKRLKQQPITNNENVLSNIRDMLATFIQQQEWIELQWKEAMDKREKERHALEQEWRRTMEKLERERIAAEQAWREKEEQRKVREESRAEKRDALLNALMNKLARDDDDKA